MHTLTILFLIFLAAGTLLEWWLLHRHRAHVRAHRDAVPEAFADRVTLEEHQKAADYTLAKSGFGRWWALVEVGLLLMWTLGGWLNGLDQFWRDQGFGELWTGVAFMLSFAIIGQLIDLPASLYQTFRIEEKFGFNRSSLGLFFIDMAKGIAVALVIGVPMLALVLWLMASVGEWWWLAVWVTWMGFSLLMFWAYPVIIAPLFNKFIPLEDQALREKVEALIARNGFSSQGVFVMDGSKRSGHGNAFFTGFGANKRIVFFDTLLEGLSHAEIEAVLAHELGHFKLRHIIQRLVLSATLSLAGLALLGWLIQHPWFFHALGVEQASNHAALILFSLLMPVFTWMLQPLMARLSRKHEFEADAFAVAQTDARDLIQALVKLYRENASTLTPDPLFSAFHDSHPPAPVRIAHLAAAGHHSLEEK